MIREHRDFGSGFSPREIAMRLERHVNVVRHAFRDCAKTLGYPIARLLTLRAGLDRIRENTNQWSTEFRCEFSMGQGYPYLISPLPRVRRMKRTRSINATDLEVRAFEVGAADFIRKPVKNSVLLARVGKVLRDE